jgi:hypothetical protein
VCNRIEDDELPTWQFIGAADLYHCSSLSTVLNSQLDSAEYSSRQILLRRVSRYNSRHE